MSETTVVIKTIGRKTLKSAIASAKREGFKPLVISDGVNCHAHGAKMVKLGKQWGFFGGMAANVGAALVETPFITFLDDDDEFVPGAGKIIRETLKRHTEPDIWLGGVRYSREVRLHNTETGAEIYRGTDLAVDSSKGLSEGNVAMPTYRTTVFETIPFINGVPDDLSHLTDLLHVQACVSKGFKVAWYGHALYLVRPSMKDVQSLKAINGDGQK